MRIGINTRSLLGQKLEGFGNYTLELVKRITENQPNHTFVLYFDRPVDPKFSFGPNVKCKSLFPPTRHPFLYVIWFQWRLKTAIHKDQLDVFWSPDGMFPLGLQIPVLLIPANSTTIPASTPGTIINIINPEVTVAPIGTTPPTTIPLNSLTPSVFNSTPTTIELTPLDNSGSVNTSSCF